MWTQKRESPLYIVIDVSFMTCVYQYDTYKIFLYVYFKNNKICDIYVY